MLYFGMHLDCFMMFRSETFLRLLKSSLPIPEEKTQSWLYKVARNLCYDILRKKKKEIAYQNDLENQYDSFSFYEMIASLPQKEQEIIILKKDMNAQYIL